MDARNDDQPASSKMKVDVAELRQGMYVCELDRPWLGTPFMLQGFPLNDTETIRALREHCSYVYVDVKRSSCDSLRHHRRQTRPVNTVTLQSEGPRDIQRAPDRRRPGFLSRLRHRRKSEGVQPNLAAQLRAANQAIDETKEVVKRVFDSVRRGGGVDAGETRDAISRCVDQMAENADAMLLLASIKDGEDQPTAHAVNVAILSALLGRQLGIGRVVTEEAALCGLLHDVGEVVTPAEVLEKPGRLTPEEQAIMKEHTGRGRDILLGSEGLPPACADVAHNHHERLDGTGYPRGLTQDELDVYARIVAVADTFDAITSKRAYDDGRNNIEAFKILQAQAGNHYDSRFVSMLTEALGVYPPGSIVQLSGGEVAVVLGANPKHKLRPRVLVMKSAKSKPISPRYLDLAAGSGGREQGLRIARHLSTDEAGVNTRLFHDPAFLKESARPS